MIRRDCPSLGPSNDEPESVRVEMRAAEIAVTSSDRNAARRLSMGERWGWEDYEECVLEEPGRDVDSPQWHAGYLAHEIAAPRSNAAETQWAWDISRPLAEQDEP